MRRLSESFLTAVADGFSPDFLSRRSEDLTRYGQDWTRVFTPHASAVARPRSTDEVSRFLRLCSAHGVAVVPSGGRTGLAGGAVARDGEVVLSLDRMNRIDEPDRAGFTVRAQAGAVTREVNERLAPHGLQWPVRFGSDGSSHVGGNIATNAGGLHVVRYGNTRAWVLGMDVVLMDGRVLSFPPLEKNNTGYDLRHLFIGSEGTLGVVTEAVLKLTTLPKPTRLAFFSVNGVKGALALLKEVRARGPGGLHAFELLDRECLEVVLQGTGWARPSAEAPAYVLMEVEAPERFEEWLEEIVGRGLVEDGTVAANPREAAALWRLREGITESLARRGEVHKNDVAVPVAELERFCDRAVSEFRRAYPRLEVYVFGHLGDGNLHLNVVNPGTMPPETFHRLSAEVDSRLFTLVKEHRGTISAEHGIGLLKKPFLGYTRSADELSLFRAVKRAFDPEGLLNPGKIFDEC